MGLVFPTTKWADSLWAGHCKASRMARQVLAEGKAKQPQFPELARDIHSALYLRHEPDRRDNAPAWATTLLDQAHDLAEWKVLRARCARNGFAAGVATETLLDAILSLVPQEQKHPPRQERQHTPGLALNQGYAAAPGCGQQPKGDDASAVRRALRQAMRQAQEAVEDAEASTDGMAEAMGVHAGAGTGPGHAETLHDLDQVRQLWALLQESSILRHIAEMAGRLQRLGQAHKKCQVTPAVGNIKGVTIGGDVDHILPSELAGLRSAHRLHRLSTLGKILSKRALQYEMQGEESETRGPIVICLDESGSMRGEKEQWSKAIAMALLTTATQQHRAWHLCGFTDNVQHEHHLEEGQTLGIDELTQTLRMRASGGTAFDPPLTRAMEVLRESPTMRKADIILVTDGQAPLSYEVADAVNRHRKEDSLHVYCIGIGQSMLAVLRPIADAVYAVSAQPERDSATVSPVIALV